MPRLFLGIDLPDPVDFDIQIMAGGVPGARWQTADQLHVTLHFLGDLDGGQVRALEEGLTQLDAPTFTMQLRGAGVFPLRGPARVLWLGVPEAEPLRLVHDRCARILDTVGIERERRNYAPHVTVARLHDPDPRRLGEWVVNHAMYASPTFEVTQVRLYSSVRASSGAKYRVEAAYPLRHE